MLDKILTDEKTFRIFCLLLIAILFFIVLRKNKKEKFSWSAPDTANKFKTEVENALGDNLTAIKNLGEFAKQITDTTSGKLDLKDVNLEVNDIKINGTITNTEFATIKSNANYAKTTVDNHKTSKQNKGNYLEITKSNYKDIVTAFHCPEGYRFGKWTTNAHWCYKKPETYETPCRVVNGIKLPGEYTYGTNQNECTTKKG